MKVVFKLATVVATVLTTLCVSSVSYGYHDKVEFTQNHDELKNGWGDAFRPGGPGAAWLQGRADKIRVYKQRVVVADGEYNKAMAKSFILYAKDLRNNAPNADSARLSREVAAEKAWNDAEKQAYDDLVNGLRNDYNDKLQRRTNEYRAAYREISYHLLLSAKSKSKPGGPRFHANAYPDRHRIVVPKRQDIYGKRGVEWEMANRDCLNPNHFNIRGGSVATKQVVEINNPNEVGIGLRFEVNGMDYPGLGRSAKYRTAECDPWCAFRVTTACADRLAKEDMSGINAEVDRFIKLYDRDFKFDEKNVGTFDLFREGGKKFERGKLPQFDFE